MARVARSHQIDVRYTGLKGSHASLDGMLSRYVFNYPSHSGLVAWHIKPDRAQSVSSTM